MYKKVNIRVVRSTPNSHKVNNSGAIHQDVPKDFLRLDLSKVGLDDSFEDDYCIEDSGVEEIYDPEYELHKLESVKQEENGDSETSHKKAQNID